MVKHEIDTGDAAPIKQPCRRLPLAQRPLVEAELDKMLQADVVEASTSPWASPLVLVTKKDGSVRFCVDLRAVNAVTKKDAYPLPRIDETLDTLSGAQWFCCLDLQSGFWQVEMSEKDKEKTAFTTHKGLYQFKVMGFGLTNAPATFERLMELVLKGLQFHKCLVYLDDVNVFGSTFEETLNNLEAVLQRFRAAGLKLKPQKCELFQKSVSFLGHVVTPEGVHCDPKKIQAVRDWPVPQNVTEVRSFLGLASYYRRFIPSFAEIASALTALTGAGVKFQWTKACQDSFDQLKELLVSSPVLAYPKEEGQFVLDTDASDTGIGAVLSQMQDGVERVIAYASKTLSKTQRKYCTTKKELLAVVTFVQHFRHYLYGQKFRIRTDHASLVWLRNFKDAEGMLARWISKLETYDYKLEHRSGVKHTNADALSSHRASAKDPIVQTVEEDVLLLDRDRGATACGLS